MTDTMITIAFEIDFTTKPQTPSNIIILECNNNRISETQKISVKEVWTKFDP
ncbi:hypothetical protein C1H46_018032 [Malus baccata]|uniref:Uncharacterized protein n=1 Tax=Malus baccata TaxID=106549 RepID=A0A540MC23_MALBA|nr:hypothetical protein C1H46_018032 [Malus baccata]